MAGVAFGTGASIMNRSERLLKRLSKAIDRAIAGKTSTDVDQWCRRWSRAYRREIYRLSQR